MPMVLHEIKNFHIPYLDYGGHSLVSVWETLSKYL